MTRKAARTLRLTMVLLASLLWLPACSEDRQQSIFDPEFGHPANWVSDHGQAALTEGGSCPECHGTDLSGGVTAVSCFEARENSTGCHESGSGGRHTTGWELASEHGRAAKARPGISSGLGSCQACHGNDYRGGTSLVACSSCHGLQAPHPQSPWRRSPANHTTTNEQNAPVCVECHADPGSDQPPGCFNGSLCHGAEAVHPEGWSAADRHGGSAKGPAEGGFAECQACHGSDFRGGTSDVACSSCHDVAAPHPLAGWEGGGAGHRGTDGSNAPVCAVCHAEISPADGCFTGNGCHVQDAGESSSDEAAPPDAGKEPTGEN